MEASIAACLVLEIVVSTGPSTVSRICERWYTAGDICVSFSIVQKLDGELTSIQEGHTTAEHPVEAALAEIEDLLSYFNDILANGAIQT